MRWARSLALLLFFSAALFSPGASAAEWKSLRFDPQGIVLAGPGQSQRFAVTAEDAAGKQSDVTAQCQVTSLQPEVVAVDNAAGSLNGKTPGQAQIQVKLGSLETTADVKVGESGGKMTVSFANDIISILTFKGCNGSGCHGSPAGQSGFKLSLFGYDVAADYDMIVKAHEGRRVNLENPQQSLVLAKPSFQIAHGGGRLMDEESEEYKAILQWLKQGAPVDSGGVRLEKVEMYPGERVFVGTGTPQRLVVMGRLSDGTTRDMTHEVRYFSGDDGVVKVSQEGALSTAGPGLTTVTARAMGRVATAQFGVIDEVAGADFPSAEPNNFIDQHVFAKLRQMNVRPAGLSSDREFVRRVYLDTIGELPTPEEVETFVGDASAEKRPDLIDRLLERREYASQWTVKFEDWFRNCQLNSQGRSMGVFKDWVREWIRQDRPYDEFVRTVLTSTGDTMLQPEANFWHPATDFMQKTFSVNKVTPTVTRLFLGVRMECAECHNHPLENFTQDDFYQFAAFFARLRVKHGYGEYRRTWYVDEEGEVEHPVTKKEVSPKFLGGGEPEIPEDVDRRDVLADWITSPHNPYFARATVNRIWHQYFGTGIVEPFDDFRSTNRPSNPELLDRLAEFFVDSGYRFKPLHRLILNSRTYQLSSQVSKPHPLEEVLFARYVPRKQPAEVLLDSISQVTGVPHEFSRYPKGTAAKDIYVPDAPDYFLTTFGLPRRDVIQERVESPTLAQALHMMNGDSVREKIENKNNVLSELFAQGLTDDEIVSKMYLRTYARPPSEAEQSKMQAFIASEQQAGRSRRRTFENILWAVLNSKEFQLNH